MVSKFRTPDDLLHRENLSALNKRQAFLFRSIPNGQSGGAGEVSLVPVKGQEFVRADFAGDGDVEKVHCPDGQVTGMDRTKFIGGANGIDPIELSVRPIAEAYFLFESADEIDRGPLGEGACAFKLTEGIEDFDTLPWCPEDESV